MTEQYQKNSINNPKLARTVTTAAQATLDDTIIVADSTAGPFAVTLPSAAQIPGNSITIKSPAANVNNVTVNTVLGETIDGAASFVMTAAQQSLVVQSDGSNWRVALPTSGAGVDTTAIHVDVAGEIAGIALKAAPVNADLLVIEDSADANNKKRVTAGTLPFFNQTTAGQIAAAPLKVNPVAADTILINDSAAADAVSSATIGSIPIAQSQVQSILQQEAADADPVTITGATGSIVLSVTGAANVAISTGAGVYAGQAVDLFALSVAGGGSYTLPLDVGTLTLNATGEGARIRRNSANTDWVAVLLAGATIV